MSAVAVFSGLAVQQPLESVVFPAFRRRYGVDVRATFEPTTILVELLRKGARADVVIGVEPALRDLVRDGLLVEGSVEALITTGLGIAVAPGAPLPPAATLEEFVALLVQARSVAYSRAGASGIYFAALIERLGIADIVNSRATVIPSGYTGNCLLDGRADVAIQQLSELCSVSGVQIVGPFPPAIQERTAFAVADVVSGRENGNQDSVRGLREVLRSSEARAAYVAAGLEPSARIEQPRGR